MLNNLIICKCVWDDYYDYRIITSDGKGHVRCSFFDNQIIISDLYVAEDKRKQGVATSLLNKVDELLNGRKADIVPLSKWCEKWYIKRGYNIIDAE